VKTFLHGSAVLPGTSSHHRVGRVVQNLGGFAPKQPGRGGLNTTGVMKPQQLAPYHLKGQYKDNFMITRNFANTGMRTIRAPRRWQESCTPSRFTRTSGRVERFHFNYEYRPVWL